MIETDRLLAYLAACSILALTPGPGIFYVMTRTLADLLVVAFAAPLARKLTGTWRRRQQLATGTGRITLGAYVAID